MEHQNKISNGLSDAINKTNAFRNRHGFNLLIKNKTSDELRGIARLQDDETKFGQKIFEVFDVESIFALVLESGEIVQFVDFYGAKKTISGSKNRIDTPPRPFWSEAKVVALAKEFVGLFDENALKNSILDNVTFDFNWSDPPKYEKGKWRVIWRRSDEDGHPFVEDTIEVVISEEIGPYSFKKNYGSLYTPPASIQVSKERASDLANTYFEKLKTWQPLQHALNAEWPDGVLIDKPALKIVNPVDIFGHESLETLSGDVRRKAKLAWNIRFQRKDAEEIRRKLSGPIIVRVDVWIDVETGAFLGADF
jgi:hypothetical protein